MSSSDKEIRVGARPSALSRAQVEEVWQAFSVIHPDYYFTPIWIPTKGDKDQSTSLLGKEHTDFFTYELDVAVQEGTCHIAIHSAKDVPDPLPKGLCVVAYTKGVDPSDVLVLPEEGGLDVLPLGARIGTSSLRRQHMVGALRADFCFVDIRGSVEDRLALLQEGKVDALVVAKAALIRLGRNPPCLPLPGPFAAMQGRLAIVAKEGDEERRQLFSCMHYP